MPSVRRVTEPITVAPGEDGFLVQITSGPEIFAFHISRHKLANVNMGVKRLLGEVRNNVRPLVKKPAKRGARH